EDTRRLQERKKAEEERQRVEKERKEQEERETAERERRQRERAKQIDQQSLFEKRQETKHQNQQRQEPVEQELQAAQWKGIRSSRSVQEANGSKYCKTSALEEINGTGRENFWAQLEKEEETRRLQERKKAEEERQRVEKERKEQEERETAERERRQRERAKQIDQQRLQEKKQEAKNINQQKSVEQELQAAQWKGIRSSRSVQEANDAAAIISQRAVNPRDIFSQKVSETQPGKSSTNNITCNEEKQLEENNYETLPSHHRVYDEVEDGRTSAVKQSAGLQQSLYAKALFDYQAADDTEITFDPGDIITVVEMADEGWWHGYGPGGHYGMFPANYVELI
ncbi:hypothetical protein PDJAM_G00087330, partial [Pangasius djambal]|nr:hypothetical protein [Pangasius djambal]